MYRSAFFVLVLGCTVVVVTSMNINQQQLVKCYICYNNPNGIISNPDGIVPLNFLGITNTVSTCAVIYNAGQQSFFNQQQCTAAISDTTIQTVCGCSKITTVTTIPQTELFSSQQTLQTQSGIISVRQATFPTVTPTAATPSPAPSTFAPSPGFSTEITNPPMLPVPGTGTAAPILQQQVPTQPPFVGQVPVVPTQPPFVGQVPVVLTQPPTIQPIFTGAPIIPSTIPTVAPIISSTTPPMTVQQPQIQSPQIQLPPSIRTPTASSVRNVQQPSDQNDFPTSR
jgi:hypothetical protein